MSYVYCGEMSELNVEQLEKLGWKLTRNRWGDIEELSLTKVIPSSQLPFSAELCDFFSFSVNNKGHVSVGHSIGDDDFYGTAEFKLPQPSEGTFSQINGLVLEFNGGDGVSSMGQYSGQAKITIE